MQLAFWNGVRILWKLAARSHSTMCSWRRLYFRASISSCACNNQVGCSHLRARRFPGDDIPNVRGSATAALKGDK